MEFDAAWCISKAGKHRSFPSPNCWSSKQATAVGAWNGRVGLEGNKTTKGFLRRGQYPDMYCFSCYHLGFGCGASGSGLVFSMQEPGVCLGEPCVFVERMAVFLKSGIYLNKDAQAQCFPKSCFRRTIQHGHAHLSQMLGWCASRDWFASLIARSVLWQHVFFSLAWIFPFSQVIFYFIVNRQLTVKGPTVASIDTSIETSNMRFVGQKYGRGVL